MSPRPAAAPAPPAPRTRSSRRGRCAANSPASATWRRPAPAAAPPARPTSSRRRRWFAARPPVFATSPKPAAGQRRLAHPTVSWPPAPSVGPLVGACDVPERCSGSTAACPPDGFRRRRHRLPRRRRSLRCARDLLRRRQPCPPDALVAAGTVCRGSAGVCDVAETCTGSSTACPTDAFAPSSTVCRSAASVCDVAENCTGSAAACPADAVVAAGAVVCRSAAGGCDVAESCDGASNVCPIDSMAMTPTAPTNLAAARGNNMATLTWTAVPGATSYTIGRSTVSGGPFTTVGTSTTTTFVSQRSHQRHHVLLRRVGDDRRSGVRLAQFDAGGGDPQRVPGRLLRRLRGRHPGNAGQRLDAGRRQRRRLGGHGGRDQVLLAGRMRPARRSAPRSPAGPPARPGAAPPASSADVELNTLGISGQAAFLCVRFVDTSNFYCAALSPTGIQIQTKVGGNTNNSALLRAGDQHRLDPAGKAEPERGGRPERHTQQLGTRDTDPARTGEWVCGGGDDQRRSVIRYYRGDAAVRVRAGAGGPASPCPCPCPCPCP